jgi:hypothetical protein
MYLHWLIVLNGATRSQLNGLTVFEYIAERFSQIAVRKQLVPRRQRITLTKFIVRYHSEQYRFLIWLDTCGRSRLSPVHQQSE